MADASDNPLFTMPALPGAANSRNYLWPMHGNSIGKPINISDWRDRTFQAFSPGAAWGGATMILEGCNFANGDDQHPDYANAKYTTLTDTAETDITGTNDIKVTQILQSPVMWVRPRTTGGTSTLINASLMVGK